MGGIVLVNPGYVNITLTVRNQKLDAICAMYAKRTGELSFDAKRRILAILQVQVLSKDGIWYVYCGLGGIVLRQVSASPPHNDISE